MDIFISSVGKALKAERQAVRDEVLKLGDRPIGMEYFGASPEPPLEECLAQLADADLMILVLGPSYGSVHSGTGVSYTENEFRYAQNAGIDVLVFAAENLSDKLIAANEATAVTKYQEFLKAVKANGTYAEFSNSDKLVAAVSTGISNWKRKHGELGRRVSPFSTGAEYFSRLLDSNKYFNHLWALVGRNDVLERIRGFATGKGTVGVLYGAGGLGKSRILREFATTFDEQAAGWSIRFLRETMPLSGDFPRGLPATGSGHTYFVPRPAFGAPISGLWGPVDLLWLPVPDPSGPAPGHRTPRRGRARPLRPDFSAGKPLLVRRDGARKGATADAGVCAMLIANCRSIGPCSRRGSKSGRRGVASNPQWSRECTGR